MIRTGTRPSARIPVTTLWRLRFDRFLGERNLESQTPNRIQMRTIAVKIGTYRQSPDRSSTRRGASGVLAGAIGTSTEVMTSPRGRPLGRAGGVFAFRSARRWG